MKVPAGVVVFRSSSEIGYRGGMCLVTTIRARRTLSKEVKSVGLCGGGRRRTVLLRDDDADSGDGGRKGEDWPAMS